MSSPIKPAVKVKKTAVQLEELRNDFVACRLRHDWEEKPAVHLPKPEVTGSWWWYWECMRCEATRTSLVAFNGQYIQKWKYAYVDGYRLVGVNVSLADLRASWAQRQHYVTPADKPKPTRSRKATATTAAKKPSRRK